MMAVISGEMENVRYLMECGADRSVRSSIGKTAIDFGCGEKYIYFYYSIFIFPPTKNNQTGAFQSIL